MPPLDDGVRELLEGAPLAHVARKARNIDRDPRVCVSLTHETTPSTMGQVRGRVVERREGPDAFRVIDRISEKYTGAPHPVREDRVLFLVESERSWSQSFA